MNKKTKQEQIEEIARVVIGAAISAGSTPIKEFLNNLYDAGYRNAEEVSKETAKEILSEIDNDLHDLAISYADKGHKDYYDICKYVHLKVISKITKKYGVEVEE